MLADHTVKPHEKGKGRGEGKGKGKGKDRDRTRSPSARRTAAEKKKIPCIFYFGTGTTCTKGRDCEFSHYHSKDSPRANSLVGGQKSVCHAFLQGKCREGKACKYVHDKKALAVVKASVKAASSKLSGSPGQSPRGGNPKAAPSVKAKAKASAVAWAVFSDDESDNESFCSDRGCLRRSDRRGKVSKEKKLKFNSKRNIIKYHVVSDRHWSKAFTRKRIGKRISEKELKDKTRTEQIKYEELRSKVKGLALERSISNPKKGNAKATITGTWKLDITVNKNQSSPDFFIEKFYREEDDDNEGNSELANAYSTVKINKKVQFIMDTGCGYNLISRRKARELDLRTYGGDDRMVFMTANGMTETKEVAKCSVDSFSEETKPFVLEQSPAVFSVDVDQFRMDDVLAEPPSDLRFTGPTAKCQRIPIDQLRRVRTVNPLTNVDFDSVNPKPMMKEDRMWFPIPPRSSPEGNEFDQNDSSKMHMCSQCFRDKLSGRSYNDREDYMQHTVRIAPQTFVGNSTLTSMIR